MAYLPTRRSVLASAALASAAVLTRESRAAGFAAPNIKVPFFLGIASYTFRQFPVGPLLEFMKELKCTHLNVKAVHLPMSPANEVAAKAEVLRAAGLTVRSGGTVSFQKTDASDIRAKFEYCKSAGITTMIAAPNHETLPLLEPFAKQYRIRVAVHNHGPEDKFYPSPLDVLRGVEHMSEWMGCCVDVGHTMRAGNDLPTTLRKVGARLFDVHMKDLADASSKESQVAVGDGIMPVAAIFRELIAMNYTGDVDLEYEIFPQNPMPGVIKSFAFMRGVLSGITSQG